MDLGQLIQFYILFWFATIVMVICTLHAVRIERISYVHYSLIFLWCVILVFSKLLEQYIAFGFGSVCVYILSVHIKAMK